jgi:hypothetical protein
MGRNEYLLPLALCGALALSACSSANKDWATATAQNTAAAYQSFLSQHAGDPHAQEARLRIAALQDDSTWKSAQAGNSLDGYQQYLQSEPNGAHAQAARDQITALHRESAWQTARSQGTATALQAFLQQYPQFRISSRVGRLSRQTRRRPQTRAAENQVQQRTQTS